MTRLVKGEQVLRVRGPTDTPPTGDQRKREPIALIMRRGKGQGRDKKAEAQTHAFWTALQTCK